MNDIDFTIQRATKRAEGVGRVTDLKDLKRLYEIARKIDHGQAYDLIRQANSEEERTFYSFIASMNMQREQKKIVERNIF